MTQIDKLRTRKRELLEQRQRLEQEGDKLSLALVKEELMDVNAQLRALTHGRRKRGKDTSSQAAQDQQQFDAWAGREDREEAGQQRATLREKAAASLEGLSARQRETLILYAGGMSQIEIAHKLGVGESTVSRTLSRAKRNAAAAVQRAVEGERAMAGKDRVDLTDVDSLRTVVLAMTSKQLVYFYLYYSEGLHMREIEALIGVDQSSVSRTIKRALLRLDKFFPGGAVLDHPEVLDEAAYWAWVELEAHPEQMPEEVCNLVHKQQRKPPEYFRRRYKMLVTSNPGTSVHRMKKPVLGKLLAMLLDRAKNGTSGLQAWIESVFIRLRQAIKQLKGKK